MRLLRPSPKTNQLIGYAFAVAAEKTGLALHALCVLSEQYVLVATDPQGRLPEFWREAHRLIANSVNALRGRKENLWSSSSPMEEAIEGDVNLITSIVETMAAPVATGRVAYGRVWPGLRMVFGDEPRTFARPDWFYSDQGKMPEFATLTMVPPTCLDVDHDVLRSTIFDAIEKREQEHREEVLSRGGFLGRRAVRKLSPRSVSECPDVRDTRTSEETDDDSDPRPQHAREQRRTFQRLYRFALELWRRGLRDVVFPAGTYHMRVHHRAACA